MVCADFKDRFGRFWHWDLKGAKDGYRIALIDEEAGVTVLELDAVRAEEVGELLKGLAAVARVGVA